MENGYFQVVAQNICDKSNWKTLLSPLSSEKSLINVNFHMKTKEKRKKVIEIIDFVWVELCVNSMRSLTQEKIQGFLIQPEQIEHDLNDYWTFFWDVIFSFSLFAQPGFVATMLYLLLFSCDVFSCDDFLFCYTFEKARY